MAWFDRNPGGKKGAEPEKTPDLVQSSAEPAPTIIKPKPKVEVISTPAESKLAGHLYKGSRITGHLTFEGSARIDGSVEGEIKCRGTLTIGEGAEVRAKVSGEIVVIRGKLEGNVTAKERVELLAPGRLFGNMATPRLIITEGVVFDGDCSMGAAKEKVGIGHSKNMNAEKIAVAQAPKLQSDSGN